MSNYRHILVGLDLSPESRQVINRVKQLAGSVSDTKISLAHVHEPISFAYGGDIPMDLSEIQHHMEEKAREVLSTIGSELGVAKDNQHLIIGQPSHEMHRFAEENDVDLIVVGSHARHGINLIFGSTANSLLHGASCDVLAVKIKS